MKKRTKNLFQVCCYLNDNDKKMLVLLREIAPHLTNQDIFRNGIVEHLKFLVGTWECFESSDKNGK
jgi:hypothetical protein